MYWGIFPSILKKEGIRDVMDELSTGSAAGPDGIPALRQSITECSICENTPDDGMQRI